MDKQFWVYMMASGKHGTLYIGVTSNLVQRVGQHKEKTFKGFTEKYGVDRLAWFEEHGSAESAIMKEKRLKKYNRQWKINLIEQDNPDWNDLYGRICQ